MKEGGGVAFVCWTFKAQDCQSFEGGTRPSNITFKFPDHYHIAFFTFSPQNHSLLPS